MFSSNACQVSNDVNYIEDVFSTYLYTGNNAAQTITNGIDLAGKGGLVWEKDRNNANGHHLWDTARGAFYLASQSTSAQAASSGFTFNSDGFTIPLPFGNVDTHASWTFRKQPKFFDVVTYTGDGVDPRNIAHNLGSVPGSMIIKCTSTGATGWFVYHRSLGNTQSLTLNETSAAETGTAIWGSTTPTSTVFTVGNINANTNGRTYVAYLFAHDAGGFGLSGNENVVSCGSFTGNSTVTLGWEPQLVMYKATNTASDWYMFDTMRKMTTQSTTCANILRANTTGAESGSGDWASVTATGFINTPPEGAQNYIYIAIRRGPMKVPTDGTTVFAPVLSSATASVLTSNFPVDMAIAGTRSPDGYEKGISDRLRGFATTSGGTTPWLVTQTTQAENAYSTYYNGTNTSIQTGAYLGSSSLANYLFRRAPSFFDEVCWTGNNGSNQRVSHNLGAVPELIIYKGRNKVNYWRVYYGNINKYIALNLSNAEFSGSNLWGSSAPTTTDFGINCSSMDLDNFNAVAYLFATCAGVSKVGSYTGTGTSQVINCGFTAGARFVLIKRTDSTGDWYVWDSARGIVSGNDPYLLLNTTSAEVTGTDYIDPSSAGFEISSTAPAAINASGGSFVFLAVA